MTISWLKAFTVARSKVKEEWPWRFKGRRGYLRRHKTQKSGWDRASECRRSRSRVSGAGVGGGTRLCQCRCEGRGWKQPNQDTSFGAINEVRRKAPNKVCIGDPVDLVNNQYLLVTKLEPGGLWEAQGPVWRETPQLRSRQDMANGEKPGTGRQKERQLPETRRRSNRTVHHDFTHSM